MCYFPEEYRAARAAVEDAAREGARGGRALAGCGTPPQDVVATKGGARGRWMRRSSSATDVDDRDGVVLARDGAREARTGEHYEHARSKSMEDARRVGARDDDAPARAKNYDLEMMMFGTPMMDNALRDDRMDGIGDSSMERSRERRRRVGYMSNGALRDVMRDNGCSALEAIIRTLGDND